MAGIFLGYSQQAGGGWSGDLLIADWEEVASAQAFTDIHVKRLKAQEVTPRVLGEKFSFPVAEGRLRQPGSDHLTSPQSDPFEHSTGKPSAETSSDGDEAAQVQDPRGQVAPHHEGAGRAARGRVHGVELRDVREHAHNLRSKRLDTPRDEDSPQISQRAQIAACSGWRPAADARCA